MTHELRIITVPLIPIERQADPATFGQSAYVCDCGHRSATYTEHERHVEAES